MKNHSRDLEYIDELRKQHRQFVPMEYICNDCLLAFETIAVPDHCPACGSLKVLEAGTQNKEGCQKTRVEA